MSYPQSSLKLIDCLDAGADSAAELFIVEGDAASLSVARARDAKLQAVLPMQGKPLNALRASERKVRAYELYAALIEALGTGVGSEFDLSRCRYARVLLLMDPDADGIHCAALMQMFFYQWMRPLLDAGRLLMVRAPLGEVRAADNGAPQFLYTEKEFFAACERLRAPVSGAQAELNFVQLAVRYRGLAAINPANLAQLCLEPATRRAFVLKAADVEMAIKLFTGE